MPWPRTTFGMHHVIAMEETEILQWIAGLLFAIIGFVIRGIFHRIDLAERRVNRLEVAMAKASSENEQLFHRLDGIEAKLDRILEKGFDDRR